MQNDHRIDFKRADVIFKSNCIHKRRIVEGALIRQLNTFPGNKAFTIDDNIIDKLICRNTNLNIHNLQEISPSSVELLANSIPSISTYNNPTHYVLPSDPPPDPLRFSSLSIILSYHVDLLDCKIDPTILTWPSLTYCDS